MRSLLYLCLLLAVGLLPRPTNAQVDSAQVYEARKFDFWLGQWDVYRYGSETLVGHSTIETIIDGLGIQETYRSITSPYHGTSLNKYNARTGQWQQFWVDNSGATLELSGGIINNSMVLANRVTTPEGTLLNRITWTPKERGEVRQTWDTSRDEGISWVTIFDGLYVPVKQD